MKKSYLVEFKILKIAFYGLQKILPDNPPKRLYLKCHHEWCLHAKNKDRSPSKISMFSAGFISSSRDFTQYLTRVQLKTLSSLLKKGQGMSARAAPPYPSIC